MVVSGDFASSPVRVVLTGSECTGKTTLAAKLAEHYGATLCSEFAREFAEGVNRPLEASDVEAIARGESALIDRACSFGSAMVIFDTDLVSTVAYAQHYYGQCPEWIAAVARERIADLYLLMDIDAEWQPDGVRDRPHARAEVQCLFIDTLRELGANAVRISGDWNIRERMAIETIDRFLEHVRVCGATKR